MAGGPRGPARARAGVLVPSPVVDLHVTAGPASSRFLTQAPAEPSLPGLAGAAARLRSPRFLPGGVSVRRVDKGTWECTLCGVLVRTPKGDTPYVMLRTSDKGRERVVLVEGAVVHRCPVS